MGGKKQQQKSPVGFQILKPVQVKKVSGQFQTGAQAGIANPDFPLYPQPLCYAGNVSREAAVKDNRRRKGGGEGRSGSKCDLLQTLAGFQSAKFACLSLHNSLCH